MEDLFIDNSETAFDSNKEVQEAINNISQVLHDKNKNDFELICALHNLRKSFYPEAITDSSISYLQYRKVEECTGLTYTLYDICENYFGLCRKTVEKLLLVDLRFISWSDVAPKWRVDLFNKLSLSKIRELLTLSIEQINTAVDKKIIGIKSTVKQIREYVKSLKGTERKENQVLEESIPEDKVEIDYNPNKHHDRKYFESLSKEELVEIVLQLQDCYESLLEDDDE